MKDSVVLMCRLLSVRDGLGLLVGSHLLVVQPLCAPASFMPSSIGPFTMQHAMGFCAATIPGRLL